MKDQEISWLIKTGDLDELKKHLTPKSVNQAIKGRSPLHVAADFGQTEALRFLISAGGNVNALDSNGMSVLLVAVSEGHEDCVRLLLAAGADASAKGPDGRALADWTDSESIKSLVMG